MNNSHQFSVGNATVYCRVVQFCVLLICTISEELVITQAVGGNQEILFPTVIIVSKGL